MTGLQCCTGRREQDGASDKKMLIRGETTVKEKEASYPGSSDETLYMEERVGVSRKNHELTRAEGRGCRFSS